MERPRGRHTCLLVFGIVLGRMAMGAAADPAGQSRDAQSIGHDRRLRPVGKEAASLLADGVSRSATIRSLIARLGTSDVIVYLERAVIDRAGVDGRTSLVSAGSGTRMVRVIVRSALANDRAVEMLGHELQHVCEIALEPRVVSEAAFQDYLRIIGFESGTGRFETEDAMKVERRIRSELKPARSSISPPTPALQLRAAQGNETSGIN